MGHRAKITITREGNTLTVTDAGQMKLHHQGEQFMPFHWWPDYTAEQLRFLARRSSDAGQTRRLLALAVIYEGGSRGEAAKTGNVGRQIIRDWVLAFNADGPDNAMCGRVICLGDGGSVGGIVLLAALDIGFDARRWDQSDLMAQLNQPTRPMMSYRAGFHADQTRRQSCKELFHSRSSELFAHDHPAGLIAPWT